MAAALLLLLQLVSLASASHHYGGTVSYSYKGRNPDGSFRVDFRNKATYDGCQYSHSWSCYNNNCGYVTNQQRGTIDRSTNAPQRNGQWCETETVQQRKVPTDKPFQMRASGCCWIRTRNRVSGWRFQTQVDLGSRSDTGKPNRSPDIAILPFLRVPQNCPRTYKLMSFDPDGDTVRCRYGNIRNIECSGCNQPSGFVLDQGSCSLHYRHAIANPSVFGFELVVEDFPERPISLSYTDGTQSYKAPLIPMRHKRSYYHTYPPTASAPITTPTPAPPLPTYWPWLHTTPTTTDNRYLHGTTPPLSKLPLQFSFLVDPPAPSCVDGLYLPKFVHPTPENGQHINAEVNKEVEIRVRAQASHATLHDIIISGPLNITKHRSTHGDFVIRWTPGPDDVGDHYPICFAVESVIDPASTLPPQTTIYNGYHYHVGVAQSPQSGIYQSEMRCVLVNIGKILVESHVTCHESSMTVEVTRSSLPGLHEDHLRLNDPSNTACNLQTNSNSTHIIAVVPLNACGTQIEEDEENMFFKNEITTVDSVHDLITRNHLLEVQFYCQYPKLGNVSQGFTAHRRNVVVWDKGFGKFSFEFEFYPDSQYRQMIDPGLYPLEYDVKNRIYMQIEAKSTVNNTQLFVESCSAAPYDTPNYWPTYSIIENGCNLDQTVQVHQRANPRQFRFSMEAFKFLGLHDQVYISCSVLMCEAGSSGTRCSQRCINSPLTGHHHHRKREAITQSARHFISQGPLRLKRSAESTGSPGTPLNLNLVFIAGCLLAAVGMISAVALYKVRASKVKYQPLPSFEN
ncbi:Oncoprotein-induced transcript 3 protein [Dissostichus eleginoides]|uniref:Oncoprotein-induced transcript 3 protein n=1 Tax=Dissostichus eleginoides TaxID=100907 RepID=A0AAD9BUV1_DISEL|nr:Oncoprotein-induced transcript 3 protein [Dissostichus eleginoides]